MKKFFSIIALTVLALGVVTSGASALSFDFAGGYAFNNTDGDAFAEVLDFNMAFSGKSFLMGADPVVDAVLDAGSYVKLSPFTLDESSYTSGVSYNFLNNLYENGFQVFNAAGVLLMEADITLDPLKIDAGTGSINAEFGLNLTNIEIKVAGSPILDAFGLPGPGGAVNFTLNMAGGNLAKLIENGGIAGSYSGSAAPVPEPATVLLLGAGIMGVFAIARKRLNK